MEHERSIAQVSGTYLKLNIEFGPDWKMLTISFYLFLSSARFSLLIRKILICLYDCLTACFQVQLLLIVLFMLLDLLLLLSE